MITSPWDLQTALSKTTLVRDTKTLCLRGGTYRGKFISSLNGGGIVRSAPGEWAIIDGNTFTTLVGAITSGQTSITLADGSKILNAGQTDEISIDLEVIKFCRKSGNNLTSCGRNASGSVGGAVSHASGATVHQAGNQLTTSGGNTVYRNFEITNSVTDRTETALPEFSYGGGIFNTGTGNSFINLVIHDNGIGIFSGSSTQNTLVYGCVIYNNGGLRVGNVPYGPALYLENTAGYSRVHETIALNSFKNSMQGFGVTGPYVGGDIQGSVFAGVGAPSGEIARNLIYGPDSQVSPTAVVNESHFYHPPGSSGYSVTFGYGAGIINGIFTNNYIGGGATAMSVENVTNLTFTGNKIFNVSVNVLSSQVPYTWNNNTYYNTASTANKFGNTTLGGNQIFANWRGSTGFDTTSINNSGNLPDAIIVRPNAYETGRANIIVYAASNPSSININLSTTGLSNGQGYTVKNAFNWYGSSVATGTYNSGSPSISVPLSSVTSVATPTGRPSAPATTCPSLCLLVVVPN